jgi:hypothetical protein
MRATLSRVTDRRLLEPQIAPLTVLVAGAFLRLLKIPGKRSINRAIGSTGSLVKTEMHTSSKAVDVKSACPAAAGKQASTADPASVKRMS